MEVNLITEALKFMVLGMGVVFIFLYIMILAVKAQAHIIGKYFPDKPPAVPAPSPVAHSSDDEQARVAAVIAAVTEFRKNKS